MIKNELAHVNVFTDVKGKCANLNDKLLLIAQIRIVFFVLTNAFRVDL